MYQSHICYYCICADNPTVLWQKNVLFVHLGEDVLSSQGVTNGHVSFWSAAKHEADGQIAGSVAEEDDHLATPSWRHDGHEVVQPGDEKSGEEDIVRHRQGGQILAGRHLNNIKSITCLFLLHSSWFCCDHRHRNQSSLIWLHILILLFCPAWFSL